MNADRLIVIGASTGGVRALEDVVAGLPADFPAAVLVVLHTSSTQRSLLHFILNRAGPLPAQPAVDGEALEPGRIYVAVPDHHLLVADHHVRVVRGPKESHYRPAVNVLFRSAAYHFGSRAIGIVLSGTLSDGSAGLYALKRVGALAVVQDPDDAASSSMPLSALRRVDIDYALPARDIGRLLVGLLAEPPPQEPPEAARYRDALKVEIGVAMADSAFEKGIMEYGEPSVYTCPECKGILFRIREGKVDRFRCHSGHAFSTQALAEGLATNAEAIVWQAVETLQETLALLHESAARLADSGNAAGAEAIAAQARMLKERLDVLRELALTSEQSLDQLLRGS